MLENDLLKDVKDQIKPGEPLRYDNAVNSVCPVRSVVAMEDVITSNDDDVEDEHGGSDMITCGG